MKISYISPLPPEHSGVADYSALLLPALRGLADVHVVRRRRRTGRADVVLYHIGNDAEAHGWILGRLRSRPGVVVLHDFVLHHLVAGTTLGRGDARAYAEALERDAGLAGRLVALGVVDGVLPPVWETDPERFPLVGEVLRHASGVIVHSAYVERRVTAAGYKGPVWRIPHPSWPVPPADSSSKRSEGPVFGCFGNLNASKRLPELLAAFVLARPSQPRSTLILGGAIDPRIGLTERLERLGLIEGEDVLVTGRLSEARLWELMREVDACVALRGPTMGETSGTVLRALSLGKPLIVSDTGWFSELPASVAAKVPVSGREAELLAAFLTRLGSDPDLRARMGEAGRAYARDEHSLDKVAAAYLAALEEAAGGDAVRDAVLEEVAEAAAAVGLRDHPGELRELGRSLREVGVGH
jgi:glycosyltransferase involved in cell wall biosynthesis